ncbi:LORF2 protein, partial [Crocuta crocuta]
DIQIKTLMQYHCLPNRMAQGEKMSNSKCWGAGVGRVEQPITHHHWQEYQMVKPLWKLMAFAKAEQTYPMASQISALALWSREPCTCIHHKTSSEIFIAVLVIRKL